MRKTKGKVELRYYDIPQNEYLIALQGEAWKRVYVAENGLMHFHNLLEIGICRSGSGILRMENEDWIYGPGMISVVPVNFPHTTISADGTESHWEYLFVDVEKVLQVTYPEDILFQQKMLERINRKPYLGMTGEKPELAGIMEVIFREMRDRQDTLYRESVRGLALSLLIQAARLNTGNAAMPEGMKAKTGFDQVRPALEYIRTHYNSPVKIPEIASVCHVSESHFRRLFEENIGMTPVEYLNQIRIHKACELIVKTGYSMEEIAVKVGFTTTSTFNRNFKRITGTSPYQWKRLPDNYEGRLSQFNIMIEKGW
ncbi:MAG: AraC family transcriptional regulator [Clostridiales bacterium]|nr:AraC family transcriptional regulator [Clostridiales bacterium]